MKNLTKALLWILVMISCSDGSKESIIPPTLEIKEEVVDFDNKSGETIIAVKTNREDWKIEVSPEGKSWCKAIPEKTNNSNNLLITVTSNLNKEQRETTITIHVEELSKKLTIRQLGHNRGILISPQILTIKPEGGVIDFNITANVEFDISTTEDWISQKPTTRNAEYITTSHQYHADRNRTEDERIGIIVVKDKDDDSFYSEVKIIQKGLGGYEAEESEINGDILIPVVDGRAVNSLGDNSHYSTAVFSRAFDGSKDSGYHSSTSDSFPKNWPITLTFNFKDALQIDYLRITNGSDDQIIEGEIFYRNKDEANFKKVMTINLHNIESSTISFPTPIYNVEEIQFVIHKSSGKYVVIKEIEFLKYNDSNYTPSKLFADDICTTLKPAVTLKDIEACPDPMFKNIAYYIFENRYQTEFRIAEYKAYPHPLEFQKKNKTNFPHSILDNPTGIFAEKGKEVVVMVEDTYGYPIAARVLNLNLSGGDGFNNNHVYPLVKGINRFISDSDGLIYIYYHTPDFKTAKPLKIHIPSGRVNGYYDITKQKPEQWNSLLRNAVSPYIDVLGEKAHLIYPVDRFKKNTPNPNDLINAYDRLVYLQQEFMGLEKYDKMDPNRVCFSVMYSGYMYATTYRTGYNDNTLDNLTKVESFTTKDIWGPAHEVGHTNQTYPGLKWHGMTEVTNNIFALYVQTSFGNNSRLEDKQGELIIYDRAFNGFFINKRPHIISDDKVNVFNQLVPFWQLHIYNKAIGNNDFYKDLFELIRTEPDKKTSGESQLEFTFLASKAAKLDLTSFFEKWGYFETVDIIKGDYSKAPFTITQEMSNSVKNRIKALNLPKPKHQLEYITDKSAYSFKQNLNIQKGSASRIGNNFTITNWLNVVAYEVYSNGKLIFISTESNFKINAKTEDPVQVFAISALGDKSEVTF